MLARIAAAYELGQSLDGTLLTISFEHDDDDSVIGIPAEALSGFIERLRERTTRWRSGVPELRTD